MSTTLEKRRDALRLIGKFKMNWLATFQDRIDNTGRLIKKGTRDCEDRWSLIKPYVENKVCIDVGSNLGYFAIKIALTGGKVYSFEQNVQCRRIQKSLIEGLNIELRHTFTPNKIEDDTEVILLLSVLHVVQNPTQFLQACVERSDVIVELPCLGEDRTPQHIAMGDTNEWLSERVELQKIGRSKHRNRMLYLIQKQTFN